MMGTRYFYKDKNGNGWEHPTEKGLFKHFMNDPHMKMAHVYMQTHVMNGNKPFEIGILHKDKTEKVTYRNTITGIFYDVRSDGSLKEW